MLNWSFWFIVWALSLKSGICYLANIAVSYRGTESKVVEVWAK